ncbi:MAG: NACHT domain-containing protein [Anaerolineae bacterium]|nr:NACHT domain-containing protein [Anaerolineae bacterium]
MIGHAKRPILQRAAVEAVLNALRGSDDLGNHALKNFVIIRERLAEPHMLAGEQAVDVVIMDYVVEIILEHLSRVRALCDLPAPDHVCSHVLIVEDFRPGNEILEAWSVLYHRYVCVDHDFSMQALGDLAHVNVRTIRRRQQLSLARLTQELIRLEQAARQRDAQHRMQFALPSVRPPVLVNADNLLPPLRHMLLDSDPPHHVVLHGPAGIGKTTLAGELAHDLIQRGQLDDLVWLDEAALDATIPAIVSTITTQLDLSITETANGTHTLRAYLCTHTVLVVLDGAEKLLQDYARLAAVLDTLSVARVIITSRVHESELVWCYHLTVSPLTREQAFAFLEHVACRRSPRRGWETRFEAIWDAVGGNPLALQSVLVLSHRLPLEHALTRTPLDQLYQQVWDQLPEEAQRVWLLTLLFPHAEMSRAALNEVAGLEPSVLDQALELLTSIALLENTLRDMPVYITPPVFVTFLSVQLRRDLCLASGTSAHTYLCDAVHLQFTLLLTMPDPAGALHLLTCAAVLGIDPVVRWHWAEQLSAQIMDAGLWSQWSQVLQQLATVSLSDPQQIAWIAWMQGVAYRWLGQLQQARAHLEQAQSAFPADVLVELGVISRYQSRWNEAYQHLQVALETFQVASCVTGIERCVHELAQLALDAGHIEQALAWLSRLDVWTPRTWGIASQAHLQMGDHARASESAAEALADLFPQHPNYARTLVTLGQIADARGDFNAAVRVFHHALDLMNQCKDVLGYARACNNLAVAYLHQDSDNRDATVDEIQGRLYEARDIQQAIGDEIGLAVTQQNLAWLAAISDAAED